MVLNSEISNITGHTFVEVDFLGDWFFLELLMPLLSVDLDGEGRLFELVEGET